MQPHHSFRRNRAHHFVVTALDQHDQERASMQVIRQGGVAESRRSLSLQFRGRIHVYGFTSFES